MSQVGSVFVAMRYRDARKAMSWLAEAFGFELGTVIPNEDDTIAHAEMFYGDGGIMFGSTRENDLPPSEAEKQSPTIGIYVIVDPAEIDAHYTRAKAAGAEVLTDVYDTDYGSREYTAKDFEGNTWSFGTYVPERP